MYISSCFLLSFTSIASAALTKDQICVSACSSILASIQWSGATATANSKSQNLCQNAPYNQSLYLCIQLHCSPHDSAAGLTSLNASCITSGTPMPPFYKTGLTDAQAGPIKRFDASSVKSLGKAVNTTELATDDYFNIYRRSVVSSHRLRTNVEKD